MRVQPGGTGSVLPADVACTPALGRTVASSTRQGLGREVRSQGATAGLGLRSGRPALRPAPRDPQRPRVKREPGVATRTGGTRAGRSAAPGLQDPRPAARPPSRPSPAHPGSSGCSGSPWRASRCRSRRRRGCPGVARRTRLPRASADTAQSGPTVGEARGAAGGVRLPEGRPGAGASPSREPGCGRPAGMTSEPTRRCVTARAGSVRSA